MSGQSCASSRPSGGLYRRGVLDNGPTLHRPRVREGTGISTTRPVQPHQREVWLRFDVNPKGRVQNIEIVESTPAGLFDNVSREAVSKWRYEPAMDTKGRTVWVRGRLVRLRFKER